MIDATFGTAAANAGTGLGAVGAAGSAAGAPTGFGDAPVLGKDEFLKLLVAQLQNQDPLSPMDGREMAVQLAEFSSVEQLMQMNEKFDAQTSSIGGMTGLLSSTLGAGLIGQEVLVRGDVLRVPAADTLRFDLPSDASVTVRVYDGHGKEVATQRLGSMVAGRHELDAGPLTALLADGDYTFTVDAVDAQLGTVEAVELMKFVVEGITFGENGMRITGGGTQVVLGDILEVKHIAPPAGSP